MGWGKDGAAPGGVDGDVADVVDMVGRSSRRVECIDRHVDGDEGSVARYGNLLTQWLPVA